MHEWGSHFIALEALVIARFAILYTGILKTHSSISVTYCAVLGG